MTEVIIPLNDMLKSGELNQDKYYQVLTNGDYGRKLLFREIIRNNNYTHINDAYKKKFVFVPIFGELLDYPENSLDMMSMVKDNDNFINNLWITCDGYLNFGADLGLVFSQISSGDIIKEFKSKNEIEDANNYLYSFQIADPLTIRQLLENNSNNRYVTIPISLYAPYINMSLFERHAGHIGLYIIDKYTLRAYFFDPNGQPSYFDNTKKTFKTKEQEQEEEREEQQVVPRNAFDDINMTFDEYAFLTARHLKSHNTIIHNILKAYTRLVSTNIQYITSEDFYKFIPNSSMLSATFDRGSCVTWTLIMDNIIHKNEKMSYEEIIQGLCKLTLIDSQRMCYQYQNGLYEIMQTDAMVKNKLK